MNNSFSSPRLVVLTQCRIMLLGLLAVLLLPACATNPVTGSSQLAMSESWELNAGSKYHQQILQQYQIYDDPALQQYVDEIGQRLASKSHRPDLKFTFTLLDSPQVNAFALPGGYVYVTRGIISYMNSEAHLAGVIGHEIGHVTARHGAQRAMQQQLAGVASAAVAIGTGSNDLAQMSQVLGGALMSGYGRKQELQSDRLGAEYIAKNNYNPQDMIEVIGLLKDQELFATQKARREGKKLQAYHGLFASHPRNDQRLQEVIKAAQKLRDIGQPEPDNGRFLRLTNGMSFGQSESQGITRGDKFYHQGLDLFMQFPQGWNVVNQPNELVGVSPDRSQTIRMRMTAKTAGVSADQFLQSQFRDFRDGRRISTSGDEAYAGLATLSDKQSGQTQNILVSAIYRGEHAFLLLAHGTQNLPEQYFVDVASSMRRLKNHESKLGKGLKIKLIKARNGDTFAKLARQSALPEYAEEQLRLINDMYPAGEPRVGQTIKIIE